MEDEFTEAMHSEFSCSPEDEIRNRVWSALSLLRKDHSQEDLEWVLNTYQITKEQMDQYSEEYYRLRK